MAIGFESSKLSLHIGDGFEYMKKHQGEFDVIITDSSDPIGKLVISKHVLVFWKLSMNQHNCICLWEIFMVKGELLGIKKKIRLWKNVERNKKRFFKFIIILIISECRCCKLCWIWICNWVSGNGTLTIWISLYVLYKRGGGVEGRGRSAGYSFKNFTL